MSTRKILPETVAYTVAITTRGYHGAAQHPSMLAALRHAQSFGGRSCVCIRRRADGKRFSIEYLERCGWDDGTSLTLADAPNAPVSAIRPHA